MGGSSSRRSLRPYLWSIEDSAAAFRDKPAVIGDSECCTFGELAELVEYYTHHFRASGPTRRVVVGEITPDLIAQLIAARRSGVALLPVRPSASPSQKNIAHEWERQGVDRGEEKSIGGIAFFTSGTMGEQKIVLDIARSHSTPNVAVFAEHAVGAQFGPHIMARSSFHAGILRPALYALESGTSLMLLKKWDVSNFTQVCRDIKASSSFLSPSMLFDLSVSAGERSRSLQRLMFGGDYMAGWQRRIALRIWGSRLLGFYGTSLGVISSYKGATMARSRSVGRPQRGLRVVTQNLQAFDSGLSGGEIAVGRLVSGARKVSWEKTGDLGSIGPDGVISVYGRDLRVDGESVLSTWNRLIETPGVFAAAFRRNRADSWNCIVEFDRDHGSLEALDLAMADHASRLWQFEVVPRDSLDRTESRKVKVRT